MRTNKFRQIVDIIRNDILNSVYSSDDKVPGENQLTNHTEFSRTTIR